MGAAAGLSTYAAGDGGEQLTPGRTPGTEPSADLTAADGNVDASGQQAGTTATYLNLDGYECLIGGAGTEGNAFSPNTVSEEDSSSL